MVWITSPLWTSKTIRDAEQFLALFAGRRIPRVAVISTYAKTTTGYEVDFIAEYPDGRLQAIQVSADISDRTTRERECRSLAEIAIELPEAELLLLNLTEHTQIDSEGHKIQVIPAWEWLLTR